MNSPLSDTARRKSWVGGLLAALGVMLVWWLCFQSPMFWVISGMGEPYRPFVDLYGLLAANDAVLAGMDPFGPYPLDVYQRPFMYSEWWLTLGSVGLGRKDVFWLGTLLAASLIFTSVIMARPENRRQAVALFGLLVSPAFLLAANRGNNDLIILVIVSGGLLCFRREHWAWRALGIVLFASSAALKYYPLVTLALLLELRTRREALWGFALYVLVLVLAWPALERSFSSASRYSPEPVWLYAFGAPVLTRNFELHQPVLWLLPAAAMGIWLAASAWRERKPSAEAPTAESFQRQRDFVCGAAMLVGLFFLGASFVYKLVFAVWLLPWMWERPVEPGGWHGRRVLWWLLCTVVWFEGVMAIAFRLVAQWRGQSVEVEMLKAMLVVQQVLTWVLIAGLMRQLLIYLFRWTAAFLARVAGGPPEALAETPVGGK